MARYDVEGDVQFVQQQMDNARQYKNEQAKKEDDFAKKLFLLDTFVARPLEATINKNAALADAQQSFKKGFYEDLTTRAETIRAQDAERLASGKTRLQYLEETRFELLSRQASETMPQADLALVQRSFREQAKQYAKNNIKEYTSIVDKMSRVPSFEELDANYEAYSDIPRNGLEFIMKGVKNAVKGQTKETIEAEGKKSKDAFYGSPMFEKYSQLEDSIKNFDALTGRGDDILAVLKKAEEESLIKGKIIPELVQKSSIPTENLKTGTVDTEIIISIPRQNIETGKIEFTNTSLGKSSELLPDSIIKLNDIDSFIDTVKPQHRDTARELLTANGGTREDYLAFVEWRDSDYSVLDVDWKDEKDIDDAFPGWYTTQIKYSQGADGSFLGKEIGRTGVWEIRADKRAEAESLGLDEKTMRENFVLNGSKSSQSYSTTLEALTLGSLIDDNYVSIQNIFNTDSQQSYLTEALGDKGILTSVYQTQIENSNSDIVKLKRIEDASIFFPESGLTGTYDLAFSKIDNQYYLKQIK